MLWRAGGPSLGARRHLLLMVDTDPVEVEQLLVAGGLSCPACAGALRPWGHARWRSSRAELTGVRNRPRRARCSAAVIPMCCSPPRGWRVALMRRRSDRRCCPRPGRSGAPTDRNDASKPAPPPTGSPPPTSQGKPETSERRGRRRGHRHSLSPGLIPQRNSAYNSAVGRSVTNRA